MAQALLQLPWETRQVAAKVISEVVVMRGLLAEGLVEDLTAMVDKVCT